MIIRKLNYHEKKITFSFQSTALVRWLGCEPVTTEITDQKKSLWGKNQAPNSHLSSFMANVVTPGSPTLCLSY